MIDFASIFRSHFFSNHHTHAKEVESALEARLLGYECVTFSGFAGLVTSVAYEMCDARTRMLNVSKHPQTARTIESLNHFLAATAQIQIEELPKNERQRFINDLPANLFPDVLLVRDGTTKAIVLDFPDIHPMMASAGVFVTDDAELAEKIRWARSSYGRRAKATVNIAANGRLSEFQAVLMNHSL